MTSLATLEEFCAREGLDPSALSNTQKAKIEALLEDASAYVRRLSGQNFTVTTHTATMKAGNRFATGLPQRPVRRIISVNGEPVDNENPWEHDFAGRSAKIEYEAGYDEIPGEIVGMVCGMVQRVINVNQLARTGVTQHSVGPYSISFAGWAIGGTISVSPQERAILRRYRLPTMGTASLT